MPTITDTKEKKFIEPERVVSYFELQKGDYVAEFGAGHGYFTIPMARAVGGEGKVFAIDVQKGVLEIIRSRSRLENLSNIELIWADLELSGGSKLKNDSVEFVLVANILFQAENKSMLLKEAHRIMRPEGRLAIIEWDESVTPFGPPPHLRMRKDAVLDAARQVGFELDHEFEAGSHHYGLLFIKKRTA